jgi:predicted AAA+ superfamily ATPase
MELCSLVIFRGLRKDAVISKLEALLREDGDAASMVERYAAFAEALYYAGGNLTEYVLGRALEDENVYVLRRAAGEDAPKLEWETGGADFVSAYRQRMSELPSKGYGIYSKHRMFSVKDSALRPVKWPDPVTLSGLKGYERQRQAVIDNTLALLAGKPAANALLFGDAGTGKSSTVKAVVNEYWEQGLRLVEISKNQTWDIPAVIETLCRNPLKFILFIDDLSFAGEGDGYYALKAALEGSAAAKAPNIVIYATSNRRHLIKESFSDRQGDDVHVSETIQELISLSARFGLTVGFLRPDKALYLRIVRELASDAGIAMEAGQLELEAERFADGGRSPRAAKQFIERLRRTDI